MQVKRRSLHNSERTLLLFPWNSPHILFPLKISLCVLLEGENYLRINFQGNFKGIKIVLDGSCTYRNTEWTYRHMWNIVERYKNKMERFTSTLNKLLISTVKIKCILQNHLWLDYLLTDILILPWECLEKDQANSKSQH